MILVVADTSPLNYLIQMGCQEILTALYGRVLAPRAVIRELMHPQAPAEVHVWPGSNPGWLEIWDLSAPPDAAMRGLDVGEAEAIQLAENELADLLLIDERKGAMFAQGRGIRVTGTLGVLLQASRQGLVEIDALEWLQLTDFRCTPQLLDAVRKAAAK